MNFSVKKVFLLFSMVLAAAFCQPVCAQDTLVDIENLEKPLITSEEPIASDLEVRIYLKNDEVLAGNITDVSLKFKVMQSEFNAKVDDIQKVDFEDSAILLLRNDDRLQVVPAFETITFEHQVSKAKMSIPVKDIVKLEFQDKPAAEEKQ
ncbi:MAG: hypothetical protein KKB51_07450 [Candidatus Riflebacteria bacterium]|nr:hypothetical protein [Candidatus Riflebacteria bacterium]